MRMLYGMIGIAGVMMTVSPIAVCETLQDHQARVFDARGESTILKKDREEWRPVKRGDLVEEGDKISTQANAALQIYFDDENLNLLLIQENTLAEFRAIEPTDIFLSDGSLFNRLEGLEEKGYMIATPTAVAAVRGTRFLRRFSSARKEDLTQVLSGSVEVAPFDAKGDILWDKKIVLEAGQQLKFDSRMLDSAKDFSKLTVLNIEAADLLLKTDLSGPQVIPPLPVVLHTLRTAPPEPEADEKEKKGTGL